MQYPAHLKPEERFIRVVFLGILAAAGTMAEFAKWCVSGTAAILALLIANLGSVSIIISSLSLKWGMILLSISMLTGVFVTQLGTGIRMGVEMIESLYAELAKPEAQAAMAGSRLPPEEMRKKLLEPFLWPLSILIARTAKKAQTDSIAGEKRYVRMFCILIYGSLVQTISAIAGLVVLACGIK